MPLLRINLVQPCGAPMVPEQGSCNILQVSANIPEAGPIPRGSAEAVNGYNKVVVYRFNRHWNGTVIAVERAAGKEWYPGLTFPAPIFRAGPRYVLQDGQLRGRISCHHRSTYDMPYWQRALFELLSHIPGARITALGYREAHDAFAHLHALFTRLAEQAYNTGNLQQNLLLQETNALQLLNATLPVATFPAGQVTGQFGMKMVI